MAEEMEVTSVDGGSFPPQQANTSPRLFAIGEEGVANIVHKMGGGGSSGGGELEARLAKLEANVEHIQTDVSDVKIEIRALRSDARGDFRLLFGAIITVAIGLAALMARGFHWF